MIHTDGLLKPVQLFFSRAQEIQKADGTDTELSGGKLSLAKKRILPGGHWKSMPDEKQGRE